jgi:hypothetical protein
MRTCTSLTWEGIVNVQTLIGEIKSIRQIFYALSLKKKNTISWVYNWSRSCCCIYYRCMFHHEQEVKLCSSKGTKK